MNVRSSAHTPTDRPSFTASLWFRVAVVGVLVVSCVTAYALYRRVRAATRATNVLDKTLGCVGVLGVEESGFYGPEEAGGQPFRWTTGNARLAVPIRDVQPKAMTVVLDLPMPTRLLVKANDQKLFDGQVKPENNWVRSFDLGSVPATSEMVVEVHSDAFIPAKVDPKSRDSRALGVRVLGITLHSGERDYLGVPLGCRFVAGVEESGFYQTEEAGGRAFRWTDGNARLVVPAGRNKPRSLEVVADVPKRSPNRMTILVNGKKLLDEEVREANEWTKELPLGDLPEGPLTIEVRTSTVVPGPKDRRPLGVKVWKVTLFGP